MDPPVEISCTLWDDGFHIDASVPDSRVCPTLRNKTQIQSNEMKQMKAFVYLVLGFMMNVIYCFYFQSNYYVTNTLPDT